MSNNGTGFWVIVALMAALSFVAMVEVTIAILRGLARKLVGRPRTTRSEAAHRKLFMTR